MTQQTRPLFELLLGEVSLKAPETPLYLKLAGQVLEARRLELEDGSSMEPGPPSPTPPAPAPAPAAMAMQPPQAESEAAEAVAVAEPPVAPETEPSVAEVDASPSAAVVDEPQEIAETSAPVVEQENEPQEAQIELQVAEEASPLLVERSAPAPEAEAPMRRARWFRGQFPVVTFEDGSSQVMQSLDALKDLLRSRGLTPHPRGDASMLLWQVRNRLGLIVGQVDA